MQCRADAPAGLLQDVLTGHGLRVSTVRADLGESFPDPASLRLAVALGSDGGTGEVARTWSEQQLEWLREADKAGTAVWASEPALTRSPLRSEAAPNPPDVSSTDGSKS